MTNQIDATGRQIMPESPADPLLLDVLSGLVALRTLTLADPVERDRAQERATAPGGWADAISEYGDRILNAAQFRGDRQERGRLLTAMAAALAIGACQPGGVTWSGRHWCTTPHPDCPNRPDRSN